MRKNDVLTILLQNHDELVAHGVRALFVFGSVARDEARSDSDVDLLVEFDGPVGMLAFVSLKRFLESLLHARVDLVTWDALRPEMREQVTREALRAA